MTIIVTKTKAEHYTFEGELLSVDTTETYNITPDAGKALRNKRTLQVYYGRLIVDSRAKAELYEEVDA